MGNFNRLGLPLIFLVILGSARSAVISLHKETLGGITLYDEERVTRMTMIVPVERQLFSNNVQTTETMESTDRLKLTSSHLCSDLNRVEGLYKPLPWSAESFERVPAAEDLKQLEHKYKLALVELANARDLAVENLKSSILQNAINAVFKDRVHHKDVKINIEGCTSENALVISLTNPEVIIRKDDEQPLKMVEVADLGRFVESQKAFARIVIAPYWAQDTDSKDYLVDFARCEKSPKEKNPWVCPKSALTQTIECTPRNLNGCPVEVQLVKDNKNFVINFSLPNGTVVIASNMEEFTTHEDPLARKEMPQSGLIMTDLTSNAFLRFGQVKIRANASRPASSFSWAPVDTSNTMIFADPAVTETGFDISGWAFTLRMDSDVPELVGRRTGALYVAAAFLVANIWWCVAVTVAILLSVAITLLTLFCRGRMVTAYREISPRLQRKRGTSAALSETTTEDDPETGDLAASDEEFEAARKNKLSFSKFNISFFGDKNSTLTDRAPTALSEPEAQKDSKSKMQKYKDNLRAMVSIQSWRKASKVDGEETLSNTATDGSDADKSDELTSVKVDEKQPVVQNTHSILDVAQFLDSSEIPDAELVDARHNMLRTRRKTHGDGDKMLMNLVDFYALVKYGSKITQAEYDQIKTLEGLPREDCSRLGYALKGLHLKSTQDAARTYRFHHMVRKFPKTYVIEDSQMGKVTMDDYLKCNRGVNLHYPGLPVVSVYPQGGARDNVPMEFVQVFEDKALIFASIRLARLAAHVEKTYKAEEARVKAEVLAQPAQ